MTSSRPKLGLIESQVQLRFFGFKTFSNWLSQSYLTLDYKRVHLCVSMDTLLMSTFIAEVCLLLLSIYLNLCLCGVRISTCSFLAFVEQFPFCLP